MKNELIYVGVYIVLLIAVLTIIMFCVSWLASNPLITGIGVLLIAGVAFTHFILHKPPPHQENKNK